MSHDPITDLRNDLVRAARAQLRPRWRRRPAILGLLAAALIVAAPAAAISGLWKPDIAPMAPMTTVTATESRSSTAATCQDGPFDQRGPRTTNATPPQRMLDLFGVLRTRQTAADRAGLSDPGIRIGMAPRMVATRFVRRLGVDAAGHERWLVPSHVIIRAREATADCPARPGSRHWLLTVVGGGGGAGGADYEELARRATLASSGIPGNDRIASVYGLVPDGVAGVTVTYPDDQGPARTFHIERNFFAYRVELPVEQAYIAEITWKAPDGTPVPHR